MRLTLLIIIVLLISCQQAEPEVATPPQSSLGMDLEEYFSALTQLKKFNGVISVFKNGEEVIQKAYNLNPDPASSTYVTAQSQFDIHSVSKLMAECLILQLEKAGKIKRTNVLSDFIPDFPQGEQISIEMLLDHTSGLPREFSDYAGDLIDLTPAQVMELAKKQKLIFAPGTDKQYSNIGYQIIYALIGTVSGQSFEQYLVDALFVPLEMEHAGSHFYSNRNKPAGLAANHEQDDTSIILVDNVLKDEFKQARIYATAGDLQKFLNFVQQEPYASELADENKVIQKDGGSDGIRAQVYTHLDKKYSFVLLANYDGIPFRQTIADIINILEDKPYEIPKALNRQSIPLAVDALEKYTGTYVFADMNNIELVFVVDDEQLVVLQEDEIIATLIAESAQVFFADPKEPESFEFTENDQGEYDVMMGWRGVKLKGIKAQ